MKNPQQLCLPRHSSDEIMDAEAAVVALLHYIGEDERREGLKETPYRVIKAFDEWFAGYGTEPKDVMRVFEDGADGCGDEMVVVRDIELYSHCEHHMAPFFGTATVAYIPDQKIIGLSKIARVVDIYARRLQVQERLTNQIADAIQTVNPVGVGVVIKATHFCMCSRGVGKQRSTTTTSALRGAMKDKPAARAEFLELTR